MHSTLFPHSGSMFSVGGAHTRNEWAEESVVRDGEDYQSDVGGGDDVDDLQSPLISRQATAADVVQHGSMRQGSRVNTVGSPGIGGGWQLAWQWSEEVDPDGKKVGGLKRIYLQQEGGSGSRRGSMISLPGEDGEEFIQAALRFSHPSISSSNTQLVPQWSTHLERPKKA